MQAQCRLLQAYSHFDAERDASATDFRRAMKSSNIRGRPVIYIGSQSYFRFFSRCLLCNNRRRMQQQGRLLDPNIQIPETTAGVRQP
jgi:hypothetical protein